VGRTFLSRNRRHRILDEFFAGKDFTCQLCGVEVERLPHVIPAPPHQAVIDHLIPFSMGGPSSDENLRVVCFRCNTKRGRETHPYSIFYRILVEQLPFVRGTDYGTKVLTLAGKVMEISLRE